jgi:DDE superfamily endonuclease
VTPRHFPPAPGWSPEGHRLKVPLNYDQGPEKGWVYGALRIRDGQALTQTARSRNTSGYLEWLQTLDRTYPTGDLYLVADHLASHSSGPIREWLEAQPRIQHAFIPVGAAWLNLIEGWWRIFGRKAFAGPSLADDRDIAFVTRVATEHLNRHAKPWVWGRPPTPHRVLRCCSVYRI